MTQPDFSLEGTHGGEPIPHPDQTSVGDEIVRDAENRAFFYRMGKDFSAEDTTSDVAKYAEFGAKLFAEEIGNVDPPNYRTDILSPKWD
jgi:hypothetical protein